MHMIDKHMYPKNYFFALTRDGIDARRSLLVDDGHPPRRPSCAAAAAAAAAEPRETRRRDAVAESTQAQGLPGPPHETAARETAPARPDPPGDGADVAHLIGAMSALQFVPLSVRFGRGQARFAKR